MPHPPERATPPADRAPRDERLTVVDLPALDASHPDDARRIRAALAAARRHVPPPQ